MLVALNWSVASDPVPIVIGAESARVTPPAVTTPVVVKVVLDRSPLEGLYVRFPSDSKPRSPPSTSPPAVKMMALVSLVDSLSVMVTVVARAAVPVVSWLRVAT